MAVGQGYGSERSSLASPSLGYPRCLLLFLLLLVLFSSFFFNIIFFSSFRSCVTEPLQPVRITDKANKNVPTNNLNRPALLKPSPFSRPLRRAAIKYATTSTQPTGTKEGPGSPPCPTPRLPPAARSTYESWDLEGVSQGARHRGHYLHSSS